MWRWWHVTTTFECGSDCHRHFSKCNLNFFSENCRHQWPFPGVIVLKNHFAPGLRPEPHWGSLRRSPDFYRWRGWGLEGTRCPILKSFLPWPRMSPYTRPYADLELQPASLACPLPCHHHFYTPFTRYNRLSNRLYSRLENRPVGCLFTRCSRLFNRLYNWTAGCTTGFTTGWMFVYTVQPVVQPVVKPVWQPV